MPYVEMQLAEAQRVDMVWYTHKPDSLKQQTPNRRGKGMHRRVEPQTAIPKNWGEFLRVDGNKIELFAFPSREVDCHLHKQLIISERNDEVACRQATSIEGISPCSHEEADSLIMLHVADAARHITLF